MIGTGVTEAGMTRTVRMERTGAKEAGRPSLWLVAALLVGQQLVLTLLHYVVAPTIGMAPGSASAIAMTIIAGAIMMAAIVAIDLRRTGRPRAVLLVAPRWDRATALTMAAALVIAQLPLIWLAANGLTVWQTGQSQHLAVSQALRASADGIWLLVGTILAAPVIEEVIYRGYLVGSLIDRVPGIVVVLISAVLFVTLHSEAANLVAALCLGVATAICAIRMRSVVPGILVHVASNAFGMWYASQR